MSDLGFIDLDEAERRAAKAVESTFTPPLIFKNASDWQGVPVPPRRWLVRNRIPMRTVTLLQGDGGMGKTSIALQLVISADQGVDWLGTPVEEPGPSIFFSAEEEEDEIHRRIDQIIEHRGIAFRGLKAVHVLGMPGKDVTLGAPPRNSDIIRPTQLFRRFEEAVRDIGPKLVVIEAAADVFAGNENNRAQVRQFLGLLRGLAHNKDGSAVVLLQHPSLTGITTGTGNSGSTQWSNSARSRLYLRKARTDCDDPNLRQLEIQKANYGPTGEVVNVRWQNGVFILEGTPSTFERAAAAAEAEEAFLKCLAAKSRQGIDVVATTGRGYAPAEFEGMPEAQGLTSKKLKAAMVRLLSAERIKQEIVGGPPSRRKHGLVRVR